MSFQKFGYKKEPEGNKQSGSSYNSDYRTTLAEEITHLIKDVLFLRSGFRLEIL